MNIDRDHLDAETVAAWIDGGLDGASLAAAEAHASNCERCQALLATVVKTDPAAALGTQHQAPGTRHQPPGTAGWWRWWMAPIAATAAAVTLWMVVPQEQLQRHIATAPATDAAAPVAGARASDEAAKITQAPPPAAPVENQFREEKRQGKLGAAANAADTAAAKARVDDSRDNKVEERFARVEAEPARAPAAPAPAAAPAESTAKAEAAAGQARIADAITRPRKQTAPIEIVSPDPRFRWRATSDGIELAVDGGRTWLPVRLPQGEVITAGASPAPMVCWMVGRRGLVLVATDGTNFTRIPFPEPVDLTAVTSTELRIATITTADGRVFHTENAGRTWSRK